MPLFFTAPKEERNKLTRSPPGSLRRTRPLGASPRFSPSRRKGTLMLDVLPTAEGDTAMGRPVNPRDNTFRAQTPPAQDTHILGDVIDPDNQPIHTPMHSPMENDGGQIGVYLPHLQGNPEVEDIIIRAHRQVALAIEAEILADRATEAARAAVQEARRLLVELERQIGSETERALSRKQEAELLARHAQNLGRYN